MSELRKIQKVGHSTLTVSIPAQYARELELSEGDSIAVREEVDGTLRLIPMTAGAKISKASIKADFVENEELLSNIIVGCYMLGYDTIELTAKNGMKPTYLERASRTIRRLRGLEMVEVSTTRLLAQSLMDPTKFPVDSLIKRLQLLVGRSLGNVVEALERGGPGVLNEVRRAQDDIDELYWLIVRQLLVALNNREIAAKIGLESPLHTSGDRVSAKTIEEIGRITVDLTEEMVRLREAGVRIEGKALSRVGGLARKVEETFNATMEGLLSSDVRQVENAAKLASETLAMEKEITLELEASERASLRTVLSLLGHVARYCNIIIEISLNRLLRKTSRICVVQNQ